jgi:competence protein ComEA
MSQGPLVSKATFRGTLVVLFLLIVIFVLPDLIAYFTPPGSFELSFADRKKRESIERLTRNKGTKRDRFEESRYLAPASAFDPNQYTLEDWMALGLSQKQAASLMKFASRGLRSDDDLRKSFIMNDELFALIKDSTFYPEQQHRSYDRGEERSFESKSPPKININTATEEELMTVRGIGPFFARNIIKRRDQLGGFHSEEQLLEVWKMDEEKLAAMRPGILIDGTVRKLNINIATSEELKTHPYLNYNIANSIVKLRAQHGNFRSVDEIRRSVLITEEIFRKIRPYLTVD